MSQENVAIKTKDGDCRTAVFTPAGAGKWPAVIFFMDGPGIRPVLHEMAQRIADFGYVVLLPDMFYRGGPYPPANPKELLSGGGGGFREKMGALFASTDNRKAGEDTKFFLDYLDGRADVFGKKVGTTGYCMGGGMSLTAAGTYPDRIAAAASFHGGNLATDSPMSPHLLAANMKGFVYVAGADKDQGYPLEMNSKLDESLSAAHVSHRCEIWPEMLHGWTMKDFPDAIYNREGSERHFEELKALYARTLH